MGNHQYSVLKTNQTISAATALVVARPGAAFGLKLLKAWATQRGGVTSAQCNVEIGFQNTTYPTGGSSAVISPLRDYYPASLFAGGTGNAQGTIATGAGTLGTNFVERYTENFNNIVGFIWTPVLEEIEVMPGSALELVFRMNATPSPTTGWDYGIHFEEIV